MAYGLDILTGGTASAWSVDNGFVAANAVDNDTGTTWSALGAAGFPGWWKYDLGVGITKTVTQFTMQAHSASYAIKNFKIQGSNDDSGYTDIYTGLGTNDGNLQTFQFSNSTAYRYYRVWIIDNFRTDDSTLTIREFQMMETLKGKSFGFIIN